MGFSAQGVGSWQKIDRWRTSDARFPAERYRWGRREPTVQGFGHRGLGSTWESDWCLRSRV